MSDTEATLGFLCPSYLGLPFAIHTANRLTRVMNHVIEDIRGSSQSLDRKGEGARIPGISIALLFGKMKSSVRKWGSRLAEERECN